MPGYLLLLTGLRIRSLYVSKPLCTHQHKAEVQTPFSKMLRHLLAYLSGHLSA